MTKVWAIDPETGKAVPWHTTRGFKGVRAVEDSGFEEQIYKLKVALRLIDKLDSIAVDTATAIEQCCGVENWRDLFRSQEK